MTPYVQDADFTLWNGDALEVLRQLPDESVDCAATSPPFYGLRDYGVDGQIGLEATPDEWCARLVDVFRELRRVLVPSGTLWIECGDSYAQAAASARDGKWDGSNGKERREQKSAVVLAKQAGVKPKDLIGAPFLLAFALRADGWWWRSTNIWHKPNCLPESATDRPTVAHSYVFQFSKSARYFCDMEAVREPAEWARWGAQTIVKEQPGKAGWIQPNTKKYLSSSGNTRPSTTGDRDRGQRMAAGGFVPGLIHPNGRNLRSVWTIPTQGFPDAHFATWPEALIERIIKMGTPEFVCRACGIVLGLSDCGHGLYRLGIILDPFLGSGTTALVARRLGRVCVGIELNADYCAMAAKRLSQLSLLAEPA